jgi:hypothetical protein
MTEMIPPSSFDATQCNPRPLRMVTTYDPDDAVIPPPTVPFDLDEVAGCEFTEPVECIWLRLGDADWLLRTSRAALTVDRTLKERCENV